MTRYRASLIHLAISGTVVATILSIVFFAWYPAWTFEIAGAVNPVIIMVSVDLVLGPLLTLIVYKHGKPGLRFDLSFIAFVQLVALSYGAYTLYGERPHFLVFAVDRVAIVARKNVDESAIRFDEIQDLAYTRIIPVFAKAPEDDKEFQAFLDSVMFDGEPDLEYRAEYWEPWTNGTDEIRAAIKSLNTLDPADEDEERRLAAVIEQFAGENIGVLPVGGIEEDIGLLVDRDSLEVVEVLRVNPW